VQATVQRTNAVQKQLLDAQLEEKREKREFMERQMREQQMQQQELAREELAMLEQERRGGRQPPPSKITAAPAHSVERTMEDAFSRYENYLNRRKATVETSASFLREQRYLSEQAELLRHEEQRRRTSEMRTYLERQMEDKAINKQRAKADAVNEDLVRENMVIATLPIEIGVDEEEETHVKMALKQTLDTQVSRKAKDKEEMKAAELVQQQHALNMVAAEMQEKRTRDFVNRQEEKEVLRQTWKMQEELKKMEATVEKAAHML